MDAYTPGSLRSVHMINFMKHDNLLITLKPNVNFITGRNGSGKSSILVAITVGLGSSSRVSGRGSNISNLIKDGKQKATIVIEIANGDGGYMRQRYGDTITITRKLTRSGGSKFEIKDFPGKSNPSIVRAELDRILGYFNIQVDNPCSIMHQDVAKEFIGSSTPEGKYDLFMRGTLLSKLTTEIARIETRIGSVRNAQSERMEEKRMLDEQFEQQKRWNDIVEAADDVLTTIHDLEDELVWSHWHQAAVEAETAEQEHETAMRNLVKQKDLVHAKEEAFQAAKAKEDEFKQRLAEIQEKWKEITKAKEAISQKLKTVMARINEKKGELQQTVNSKERMNRDLANKEADKQKLQEKRERALEESNRKREQFIAQREKILAQVTEELETVSEEYREVRNELSRATNESEHDRHEVKQIASELQNVTRKLTQLRDMYKEDGDSGLNRIRQDSKFTFQPIGPLRRYVKLEDQSWGVACQHIIGRYLGMFIVSCNEDEHRLRSIIDRGGNNQVRIAVRDFTTPRYPREDVPPVRGAASILDMLTITDEQIIGRTVQGRAAVRSSDVITNVLMDICGADRIWCIEDDALARETAFRNGMHTITKSGVQYRIQSGYEVRIGSMGSRCFIDPDESRHIERLEREEADLRERKRELDGRIREVERNLNEQKKRKNDLERKRNDLAAKQTKVKVELENPPDEVDDYDSQINVVEDRIRKLKRDMAKAEEKIPELRQEVDKLAQEKKSFMTQIQELSDDLSKTEDARTEGDDCYSLRKNAEREFEKEKRALANLQERISKSEEKAQKARSLADDTLLKARRHNAAGEEKYKDSVRPTAALISLLKEEKQKYEEVQKLHGLDFNKVRADYHKARAAVERATKYLRDLSEFLEKADSALNVRKVKLQQIQHSITRRAKVSFIQYQNIRKYIGKLKFDHQNKTVSIKVRSKSDNEFTEVTNLSGGEKSYSLVSRLLSLWDVMEAPFYCVDEFDVFMDDINRQAATNLLIKGAETMLKHQFIYITPLSLDAVKESPNCAVFEVRGD